MAVAVSSASAGERGGSERALQVLASSPPHEVVRPLVSCGLDVAAGRGVTRS